MNTISDFENKLKESQNTFVFEIEKSMIQMRIMSEIEKEMDNKNMSKAKLAELTGLSASFITQLFRGHKNLNLETIAKFQFALDKKFNIKLMNYEELLQENEPTTYVKMKVYRNDDYKPQQIAV